MANEKTYLSKEQIAFLEQGAKDIIWQMGLKVAAFSKKNWCSLLTVSGAGLIHFYGNNDTGWDHISRRHQMYSSTPYFGKGAQANPSKFTSQSIPLEDYVKIADDIFINGVLDTKEHPDSEVFVKYVGKSSRFMGANGEEKDFVLILYRNTKIVHSIFPKKNLQGKAAKRILENFARDTNKAKAVWEPFKTSMHIVIPYVDHKGIYRYVLVILIDLNNNEAVAFLEVYNPDGSPSFVTNTLLKFTVNLTPLQLADSFERLRFINGLVIEDFSHIEKTILQIEKEKFPQS